MSLNLHWSPLIVACCIRKRFGGNSNASRKCLQSSCNMRLKNMRLFLVAIGRIFFILVSSVYNSSMPVSQSARYTFSNQPNIPERRNFVFARCSDLKEDFFASRRFSRRQSRFTPRRNSRIPVYLHDWCCKYT